MKSRIHPKISERIIPGLTITEIIYRVAQDFDVPRSEIMSERRSKWVVEARHVVMWLAYRMTPLSFLEIGDALNRDRTSVIHGVGMVDRKRADLDSGFALLVDGVIARLSEAKAA